MSGINYPPPVPNPPPPTFNYANWLAEYGSATMNYVNSTFLKLAGGTMTGNIFAQGITMNSNLLTYASASIIIQNTQASIDSTTGSVQSAGGFYFGANSIINANLSLTASDSHITLSGNASGINLTGNNSHLTLSGSGSHINISNTENANSTGSQGAIKCQGGIYTNGGNFFNNTTQMNGLVSILNTTDSTSYNNGSLTINGGVGIAKSMYINGNAYFVNTTDSTSYNSGSVQILGGVGIAKSMYINGNVFMTNTTDSTSYNTGVLQISGGVGIAKKLYVNSNTEINSTFRITSSNTPSSGVGLEMNYSTALSTANIYSYDRSGTGYKKINLNDIVTIDKANNSLSHSGILNINYNTSQININNPSNGQTALIEFTSSPALLRLVKGYAVNISSNGVRIESGSSTEAQKPLDFGSNASDCIISLFGNGSYGFGANDLAIKYSSANHHFWYTGGLATTLIGKLDSVGTFAVKAGIHSEGFASPGNNGAHMHFGGGTASFFGYDYPNAKWLPTQIGSCAYIIPSDPNNGNSSFGGISINSTTYICPLYVNGYKGITRNPTTSYGYLASSGAGSATATFTNRPFSAYFEFGLLVASSEINSYSDMRTKENINIIDESKAFKILETDAINYTYKNQDNSIKAGFNAQELLKMGFTDLVGLTQLNGEQLLEKQTINCDNGDIIELQEDEKLVLNMQGIIPYLHTIVKKQKKDIDQLQELIEYQQKEIIVLQDNVKFLLIENKENNERLDELIDHINDSKT